MRHRRPTTTGARPVLGLLRLHPWVFAAAAVSTLAATGLALVQPIALNWMVSSMTAGRGWYAPVACIVAVTTAESLLRGGQTYLIQMTSESVTRSLRTELLGRLLRLPLRRYESLRRGDLVSRVGSDTQQVRDVLATGVLDAMSCVFLIGGALVMMTVLDPVLASVTLLGTVIACLSIVPLSRSTKTASQQYQSSVGHLSGGLDSALSSVRLIRSYAAETTYEGRLREHNEAVFGHGVRLARLRALVEPVFALATQGAFLAVLGLGAARVASGSLSLGALVAFLLYLLMAMMPVSQLLNALTSIQTGTGALTRVRELTELPVEPALGSGTSATPQTFTPGAPVLQLSQVTFEYRCGAGVHSIDLEVPEGSHTALVGPSGAGKSTILALAEGFYAPDSGAIRFRGCSLQELDKAQLRRQVHLLEQNVPPLAGSLEDNLRLANPGAEDDELIEALAQCGLEHVLGGRGVDGLRQELGDLGGVLSGGERQRLGWARLLLSDRELLLLDEPTSNVDPVSEARFARLLAKAAAGRTVVTVAHRLGTVRHADQIVVVQGGTITDRGTHDELVRSCELYRRMAQQQRAA